MKAIRYRGVSYVRQASRWTIARRAVKWRVELGLFLDRT
jgi:hypothetical protein